jgi:hypothetical protein
MMREGTIDKVFSHRKSSLYLHEAGRSFGWLLIFADLFIEIGHPKHF